MLRPWVWKEGADGRQRPARYPGDEIEDIAVDDTDVAQTSRLDGFEHGSNSRRVHIDADDVLVRTGFGHLDQRLPGAEPDVEYGLFVDAGCQIEHIAPRQRRARHRDPPPCHRPVIGDASRRGEPTPTRFERALWRGHEACRDRHGTSIITATNVQG